MAIEGKSGSIYLVQLISCLSCANLCAFNGNLDRYTDYPYKDCNGNEAENDARVYSKVTVSSCVITSVKTQNTLFNP